MCTTSRSIAVAAKLKNMRSDYADDIKGISNPFGRTGQSFCVKAGTAIPSDSRFRKLHFSSRNNNVSVMGIKRNSAIIPHNFKKTFNYCEWNFMQRKLQIGGNPRSRLAIQAVEKHIAALKAERPNICASELRARLIEQEVCSRENAPTVSSINRCWKLQIKEVRHGFDGDEPSNAHIKYIFDKP